MPLTDNVSEEESAGEEIPFRTAEQAQQEAQQEDEDAESDEEGVYVVEKIVGHEFRKDGSLLLNVKWKGYDDPADQTLEPEAGLVDGAKEIVEEYYDRIGGRPQAPEKSGRKRKSMGEAKSTPESSSTKRSRKSRGANGTETDENGEVPNWVPNSENWDRDVLKVETIVRDPDSEGLMAYLHWSNGRKSRVSIDQCYEKIPLKMLKFYEQHLVFKEA